jgi:GNAT superfamily N-acetyltransferase
MILFEPLSEQHDFQTFRSGGGYLDYYLQNDALREQARDLARTFVAVDTDGKPEKVIGYFTLKLTPQYVPQASGEWVALAELAYLARDSSWRGLGLGSALLLEALRYVEEISRRVGFPGVFLYATEEGMPLYEGVRFKRISADRKAYFLGMAELREVVAEAEKA